MIGALLNTEPKNRWRLFWLMQAAGWGVMTLLPLVALREAGVPLPDAATIASSRGVIGFVFSAFLLRPLLRGLWRRRPRVGFGWVIFVGCYCLALGWVDRRLGGWLILFLELDFSAVPMAVAKASWIFRGATYLVWTVLYGVVHHWFDTQDTRLRLAQLQAERRAVELQQLRAQMNPHFLFNAFNSILAEAENPKAVTTLTEGMSEYLRFSLRQTDALQKLGDELDALEHYLSVEKIRFEERFDYAVTASEAARERCVPGALVQPLVENAIKYGQRTSRLPLRLEIAADVVDGGELVVTVANTGAWIEPRGGGSTGRIGLTNLRRRLELLYGDAARCECVEEGGWVRVSLRLPLQVSD